MVDIAYIIGHRSCDQHRVINLLTIIHWLYQLKRNLESNGITLSIVVVEQDEYPTLDKIIPKYVEYYFVINRGFYNRGWAFNVGYQNTENAYYYFFADNDIVLPYADMMHVFKTCYRYEAVNPYAAVYDSTYSLEYDNYHAFCKGWVDISGLTQSTCIEGERPGTCFSGGIVGLSHTAIRLLAGWDERFRGRGWEDYAMTSKINLFLKNIRTYSYDALHLKHPWENNTTRDINSVLDSEYAKYCVEDYISLIISTHVIGNNSKYEDIPHACEANMYISSKFRKRSKLARERYEHIQDSLGPCDNIALSIYLILSGREPKTDPGSESGPCDSSSHTKCTKKCKMK